MRIVGIAVICSVFALPAGAFVRSEDSTTGVCLFWQTRDPHWLLNQSGSEDVPIANLQAAVTRSFQTWQDVSCSDMGFTADGLTPRIDVGFDPNAANNVNLLVWRETSCDSAVPQVDPCFAQTGAHPFACADKYDCWNHGDGILALTTTNYNRNIGNIVDADIEFNGAPDSTGFQFRFTTVDGPPCTTQDEAGTGCVATDVQNTATHEIGHFVGLAHSPVSEATMFASAPIGETSKRSLDQDDINGLCAIYPAGKPPTTCTPSGTITVAPAPSNGCGGCASASSGSVLLGALAILALRRRRSELP